MSFYTNIRYTINTQKVVTTSVENDKKQIILPTRLSDWRLHKICRHINQGFYHTTHFQQR